MSAPESLFNKWHEAEPHRFITFLGREQRIGEVERPRLVPDRTADAMAAAMMAQRCLDEAREWAGIYRRLTRAAS